MGIRFTQKQQKVLEARGHNVLVSAAAGSGKTAVLVERIVRLITEPGEGGVPADIDRLLVVTFTRAAAAQMRERIAAAIGKRLLDDPGNAHLQRQETLLHRAQITTIDSFCTFLLRNHFGDIGLDPSFRQADEMEAGLLQKDILGAVIEEAYAENTPEFAACTGYFCPGLGDGRLEELILDLYRRAMSHPWPEAWLRERAGDYRIADKDALCEAQWRQETLLRLAERLGEMEGQYAALIALAESAGGPYPYAEFLAAERAALFGNTEIGKTGLWGDPAAERADHGRTGGSGSREDEEACGSGSAQRKMSAAQTRALSHRLQEILGRAEAMKNLPRVDARKYPDVEPARKAAVQSARNAIKKELKQLRESVFGEAEERTLAKMEAACGPLQELLRLTGRFMEAFGEAKREKNIIDFDDLEHFALQILCEYKEDGSVAARRTALAYRSYFHEILIDEYQDSNDVQELLLSMISGEQMGRFNRFMVGDVKQSIYKFRLARPEIFMEKFDAYRPDDRQTERIDLDQNFRSRKEVLGSVNAVSEKVMRREVGGVGYDDSVSLKPGAVYPEPGDVSEVSGQADSGQIQMDGDQTQEAAETENPYCSELLIVDETQEEGGSGDGTGTDSAGEGGGTDAAGTEREMSEQDDGDPDSLSFAALTARKKEALAIAHRIRDLVGVLPVTDEESGEQRPAQFRDVVVLLRSNAGWDEEFRSVFEEEGIPSYVNTRTGYFAAQEIREMLQLLRVLDNPRQDIPLYGAMRSYFGQFTEEELACVRAQERDGLLYDAVRRCAGRPEEELSQKCDGFLSFVERWRGRQRFLSVAELLAELLEETGFEAYAAALPGGAGRQANLKMLCAQAASFTKTSYTGLFQFLRYIDQMKRYEIDYGEANTLDEKADVVRIMSIHKSKGLEFPVCFVAGLSKRFNRQDASGDMIIDNDWGVGLSYIDPKRRVRSSTMRKDAIADKIRRDSLGEELRVLYVAMTRAREKLILSAYVKEYEKKTEAAAVKILGMKKGERHLPVSVIEGSGSFLDLVVAAQEARRAAGETVPFQVRRVRASELSLRELEEQMTLGARRELLRSVQRDASQGIFQDPALARTIAGRFAFRYPQEGLEALYTKTTVSELKRAARGAEYGRGMTGDGSAEAEEEESAALFAQEEIVPYIPRFAMSASDAGGLLDLEAASGLEMNVPVSGVEAAGEGRAVEAADVSRTGAVEVPDPSAPLRGAARGTAIHRFMELFDYARFENPASVTAGELNHYTQEMLEAGKLLPQEREVLLPFLRSPLADRMARAARRGELYREQPFVMGIAANRLNPEFPEKEQVLIQGIIDVFFIEEGNIIVADYKTDRVRRAQDLTERYRVQLDYYAEALGQMLHREVSERIIYSFALGQEIYL
ncbi:MAG: UvrD-helicase domain-containing protein [Eubacteriales bacterium]|nr:UvrD-helicase domain-containing protein [Eubacteriales bacterium]